MIHYEPFMLAMEEKRQKREEETKQQEALGKKKRRPRQKPKDQPLAASFGEAMEKIVQEKKLSSKINYDVLKSLIEPPSCSVVVENATTPATPSDSATITSENVQDKGPENSEAPPEKTVEQEQTITAPPSETKPQFRRRLAPKVNLPMVQKKPTITQTISIDKPPSDNADS